MLRLLLRARGASDLVAVLLISFGLLVTSAVRGVFIVYPLLAALILLIACLLRRGFSLGSLLRMGFLGARQALPVVKVLLLIGIVTAVWMAAGTVPALVYYGTGLISGRFFLLWAFVLTGVVSTLMGTSFGAVGTIGISLMVIARGGEVAAAPVAGAIIAGAFVGDRCSPMSSSAHLVASVTQTDLYINLQNMLRTSMFPLLLSVAFYTILSFIHSIYLTNSASAPITALLPDFFDLSLVVLLPALAIVLLAVLRIDVKVAMLVSIGISIPVAHFVQHTSFFDILRFSLVGFQLGVQTPLQAILLGGGLLPMAKATLVVLISTAFAGIFLGSRILEGLCARLDRVHTQGQLMRATTLVSVLANLFGCTQTIAIVMTGQIMQPHYRRYFGGHFDGGTLVEGTSLAMEDVLERKTDGRELLALTIEDTAVMIAPLVPWNIAGLIPAAILGVGPGFILYAVYLFLLPLFVVVGGGAKRRWRRVSVSY